MCTPQINCYGAQAAPQYFTFYILSKGNNAGQPQLLPWVNSFAVHCKTKEELDFYFWLTYSLWQTGRFRPYLQGSVIPFLRLREVRELLTGAGKSIFPHWQSLQGMLEALNQLKTTRAYMAQCIIAHEKLQQMLLSIHF